MSASLSSVRYGTLHRAKTENRNIKERLGDIPFVDFPLLKLSKHESTEMPFRYVKNDGGQPIMPEVSNVPHLNLCQRVYFNIELSRV